MGFLAQLLANFELKTWLTVIVPVSYGVYYCLWVIYARTLHPLAGIPGPFWPSISRTWLMYRAYAGDLEIAQRALHERYGALLRVAPDEVVCSDPREVPNVYPIARPLEKTVWYHAWRPAGMGSRPDMFTNTSEKDHAAYQRIIGHVYSLSSVLQNESALDKTVALFIEKLDEFAEGDRSFDFGLWLEMYSYDNIGVVFFGKQFGFLRDSIDYGGYIQNVHKAFPFLAVVAMSPTYIRPFLMVGAIAIPKLLEAVLAVDDIKKTAERETFDAQSRAAEDTAKRVDMTSKLLSVVHENGAKNNFGLREVVSENWIAVIAGSDSTSIGLRSIFYFLMKHPYILKKTRTEIDAAFADGKLTSPVQYNQTVKLPYLMAVVKESFRLFGPFAVSMQRYSPPQGIVLNGTRIPGGYRIGLNPAVVQHNKDVFGDDAALFRPERWLEDPEHTKLMEKCMIHFGAGSRSCTGKNVALAETYKIVPEILRRYDFEMVHNRPWKTQNAGFNFQTGIECNFRRRALPL